MNDFTLLISARAYREGYTAYIAGASRHVPAKFGTYSSSWVYGWDAAALATTR
ncbi:MAG: hypothetical protein JWR21_2618 [Herminiimonas sp.]|nr:hypothetical protein [Herminiimonas sp.]